jgi:hypothetical protein
VSEAFFGSLPGLPANRDLRRPMAGLFGDPLRLAGYQFRLAQDLCAECRDYHALWPYRRLSGMVFGVETGASIVEALFRDVTPPNGRVLIVGSADAGPTDLVVRATKGLAPSIDVVDRCATPLAVCRRYAEMHGLSISTRRLDCAAPHPRTATMLFSSIMFCSSCRRIIAQASFAGLAGP